jgi:hypothetical protein
MTRLALVASALVALSCLLAGCSGGDPAPTVGDAEITKNMPAQQTPPPSAEARKNAEPQAPTALPLDK